MKPRTLLKLYPRRWRERYGHELLALIEQNGLSGLQTIDVIRAALRERASAAWHVLTGGRLRRRSNAERTCPHCATALDDASWLALRMRSGAVAGRLVVSCGSCGSFLRLTSPFVVARTAASIAWLLIILAEYPPASREFRMGAVVAGTCVWLIYAAAAQRVKLETVPVDYGAALKF